jgi:uroporphyrinogen-III synthase
VLFCRAAEALPTLGAGLRSNGWSVDEVETYAIVVPGTDIGTTDGPSASDSGTDGRVTDGRVTDGRVQRARHADAVVFASPSAVRGFVTLLSGGTSLSECHFQPDLSDGPAPVAVCIGESTASQARALGFESVAIANDASDDGLIAATVGALKRHHASRPGIGS